METLFYIFLFLFGAIFGSFASVIIYRTKNNEKGIICGRSQCPKCESVLNFFDLIPVISYIINLGKCRRCSEKISSIYPFLELSMAILFSLIGYFLIDFNLILNLDLIEITKLFFWLFIGFITIVYTFYDILFLEIPEFILFISILVILIFLSFQTSFSSFIIIENLPGYFYNLEISIISILFSAVSLGFLYYIMLKGLKEIYDFLILALIILGLLFFKYFYNINLENLAILNGFIGALGIFIFFFLQIVISKGKWIGGGDLRIAILIGLIMGTELSFYGIMSSYFIGSIIGIFIIFFQKIKKGFKEKLETQVPFGPILALGFFTTIFFKEEILDFAKIYLYF